MPVAPSALPRLPGNRLLNTLRFQRDPILPFLAATALGAPVVAIKTGPATLHVACTPEAVQDLFVSHGQDFGKQTRGAALLRAVVGNSMLTSDGDTWRQRRKLAQPAFQRTAVLAFAATMEREADQLVDRWSRTDGPVAVEEATMGLALNVVSQALFGTELGPRGDVVHHALNDVLSVFVPLLGLPLPSPERWPVPQAVRFRRAVRRLDEVVGEIVAERRRVGGGDDLLGRLMSAHDDGATLDDRALRDELVTLLLAGHETTANALAWTLGLLSLHPGAARRLEEEVDALTEPVATASTPWLDAVLKESLRLYPPAWILARSASEDVTIAGCELKKGSFVFACAYALHRGPWYENPEGFDPERWSAGDPPRGAWIPFGIGGRKCIGEAFAMLEARIALAAIARRVRLSLLPGVGLVPVPSVTLRPRGPLWMTVRPRGGRGGETDRAQRPR